MAITSCCSAVLVIFALVTWSQSASALPGSTGASKGSSRAAATPPPSLLPKGWSWAAYHTPSQIHTFMVLLAQRAPSCVKTFVIGKSVQGREIRGLEITDFSAKGSKGFRPPIRWIGAMHGNEVANMEIFLRYAYHLAANCRKDARISNLLANTRIYIVPSANPDGLNAVTRENARDVDLNRNYPVDKNPTKPSPSSCKLDIIPSAALYDWCAANKNGVQPENAAMMKWFKAKPAVLSANGHGGALVANYPLDYCDTQGVVTNCPSPEDPLPLFLAQVYSFNHPLMRKNGVEGFINGTIRGSKWYPVMGSLQDWVYYNTLESHITLELHDEKKPSSSFLPGMWPQNLNSLLRYSEVVHVAIRGKVVDAAKPSITLPATVDIVRPGGVRPPLVPTKGFPMPGLSFYKLVAPGQEYCIRIRVPGRKEVVLLAYKRNLTSGQVIRGTGMRGLAQGVLVKVGMGSGKRVLKVGGTNICNGV